MKRERHTQTRTTNNTNNTQTNNKHTNSRQQTTPNGNDKQRTDERTDDDKQGHTDDADRRPTDGRTNDVVDERRLTDKLATDDSRRGARCFDLFLILVFVQFLNIFGSSLVFLIHLLSCFSQRTTPHELQKQANLAGQPTKPKHQNGSTKNANAKTL